MAIKLHYSNLTTRGARNSILRYYDILTSELGLVMPHYLCPCMLLRNQIAYRRRHTVARKFASDVVILICNRINVILKPHLQYFHCH